MPKVSIILPTYDRAKFLPQAFESIRGQTFADWELLVVDDGSTDDTAQVVAALSASLSQPVRYIRQENQGPAAARNAGIDQAKSDYLAFFDSDDYWLPHHLQDCVAALEANAEVDWVYGACRMVEHATGRIMAASTFYIGERPRSFLQLRTRAAGPLRLFDDPDTTRLMIEDGLFCGLQCSAFRRRVFDRLRLPNFHVGEDRVFVVQALKAGYRLGYLDNIHVLYHEHPQNSSALGADRSLERRRKIYQDLADGYALLRDELPLTAAERRAVNHRLGVEYFWHLGYATFWQHGRRGEALAMYRRGLRVWPWSLACWKTCALAHLRALLPATPTAQRTADARA